VDVVEILPTDVAQRVRAGQQASVDFKYSEINPLDETWVQYLAYAQVNEINRALLEQAIAQAQQKTGVLANLPPEALVSPLLPKYENTRQSLSFVTYYAPAVLALILQHIAVTLGALSLVRERLLGAMEFFRVAPVSVTNILLGKYLGYTVFLGIIGAVLVGLLLLLGIPFLGNVSLFIGLAALVILASLGIGFLISAISTSDSQAVQLSMLVLLASIFFGGFFLPLENFFPPIRIISYALPLTHGIIGFQDIMLKGTQPQAFNGIVLGVIAAFTFIAVNIILRRQFQRL
jgi:ABC-2 type transport system permease protein